MLEKATVSAAATVAASLFSKIEAYEPRAPFKGPGACWHWLDIAPPKRRTDARKLDLTCSSYGRAKGSRVNSDQNLLLQSARLRTRQLGPNLLQSTRDIGVLACIQIGRQHGFP